jgi:uncharacterized membrane protein YkoI
MSPQRLVYGTVAAVLVAGGLVAAGLAFAQGQSAAPATPEQAAVDAAPAIGAEQAASPEELDALAPEEAETDAAPAAVANEPAAIAPAQASAQQQTPAPAPAQPPVAITADQARGAALGAVPGTVLEQELDDEAGRAAWEVKVLPQAGGPAREVVVDASTGAVLSNAVDDDADEAEGADTDD